MHAITVVVALAASVMAHASAAQNVVLHQSGLVRSQIEGFFVAPNVTTPVAPRNSPPVKSNNRMAGANLLNSLVARGRSQGFDGILFENRDRDHSSLPRDLFPTLTYLQYEPVLQKINWDFGLALRVLVPNPLIGNSSTALTSGPSARSLVRLAMTGENTARISFAHYAANSLYLYPEHRDHDDRDLFPANWPYTVMSQGSSGSDQPFMRALLMTLAAFSSDTRAILEQNGLIAPALQMIMRRNLVGVNSASDYMSGRAHPSAFEGKSLRPERMIVQAAAMSYDAVPPMIRLNVVEEDFGPSGGLIGRNERLFTTPSAIARIWRRYDWSREIVVSAEETKDPNGRPLNFYWSILRGDPQKILIEPLNDSGSKVRIRVMWHDDYTIAPVALGTSTTRVTARIDIGVFANNGANLSAPGFVSVSFPTHQKRSYGAAPDGKIRLNAIDYDANARNAPFDRLLHWSGAWSDRMSYDENGALLGWTRDQGDMQWQFAPDGRLADGRRVTYHAGPNAEWTGELVFRVEDD